MTESHPRIALLSPHRVGASHLDALVAAIGRACATLDVAAIVLRLAPADERSLVNLVKRAVPAAQAGGAALVVACAEYAGDLVSVSARGGADGIHLDRPAEGVLRDLRSRLSGGRILGAGGLESKHAAMEAGEAGVDYVMFGGSYPDGAVPEPASVLARTEWWAEIFETPCIAVAHEVSHLADLAGTGAEFLGLDAALWMEEDADLSAVGSALSKASAA